MCVAESCCHRQGLVLDLALVLALVLGQVLVDPGPPDGPVDSDDNQEDQEEVIEGGADLVQADFSFCQDLQKRGDRASY